MFRVNLNINDISIIIRIQMIENNNPFKYPLLLHFFPSINPNININIELIIIISILIVFNLNKLSIVSIIGIISKEDKNIIIGLIYL